MKMLWQEVEKQENEKDEEGEKENNGNYEDETDDGNSSNTDLHQDSDISFMNDTDEELDTAENWRRRRVHWIDEEKHRWSHVTDESSKKS